MTDGWERYLFAVTLVFAVLIHFVKGKGPAVRKIHRSRLIRERITGKLSNSAGGGFWYQRPQWWSSA